MVLPEILPSAFAILFVTVGPIEVAPFFLTLTHGMDEIAHKQTAFLACMVGFLILLGFAFVGNILLALLGISLPAFRTAGGVLLLKLAADLLLQHRSELSSINRDEEREAQHQSSVAVFPLALPMIAGPGSITGVILLMTEAGTFLDQVAVLSAILIVLGATFLSMRGAHAITRKLGVTGGNILARISGILLAALAMQFILDGLVASRIFR